MRNKGLMTVAQYQRLSVWQKGLLYAKSRPREATADILGLGAIVLLIMAGFMVPINF